MRGAIPLLGARRDATQRYTPEYSVGYRQYSAEGSPVVDLVHAAGQLMGHRDADAILRLLMAPDREALTARLVGAMLRIATRSPTATPT
ncbi:MAG: hypothetical protein U0325_27500 [Polyangiales bacterium]